jgi:hypothetical protein
MPEEFEYFAKGRASQTTRPAGTSARTKAAEELAAAPVRSRVARLLRIHTDERAWRRGAEGEEKLGKILSRLPSGWHVFHDLPIGSRGANVDHLVIGPGGVITINTKNLTGKVWVASRALLHNGRKTSYLPAAVKEAAAVSARLTSATARPIIAIPVLAVFAESLTIKAEPTDVRVVRGERIDRWLMGRPAILPASECSEIARAADDPGTWLSNG